MYCPCYSTKAQMTYQQQVCHLAKLGHFDCPWDAILIDFAKEIQQWQERDNQMVVLINCIEDSSCSTSKRQWARKLGLVEAIA